MFGEEDGVEIVEQLTKKIRFFCRIIMMERCTGCFKAGTLRSKIKTRGAR